VLNLAASPDGRLLGCTIAPVAYAVDAESGQVVRRFGGHKVVSKVVFSPDSRRLATSDLRADGVIILYTLK
jgi:WD40 repeat protein